MNGPERKYAMTKISKGDYLLPGNDGKTIYRLEQYEDGPSYGLYDWPRDKLLWAVWRWTGDPNCVDVSDSPARWCDYWELVADVFPTRREAIGRALLADGEQS